MAANLPAEPAGGEPIRSDWGRMVIRYLRAITPCSSNDLRIKTTACGTTFEVVGKSSPSGSGTVLKPFDVIFTANAGNYDVTLFPGALNQLMPSNIFTPISYDPTTTRYVKLSVTTDGRAITGLTVALSATPTTTIGTAAGGGATTFDILIAVLVTGTIYQVRDGNLRATLQQMLQTDKAVPVPGASPYTFYYTWVIAADV